MIKELLHEIQEQQLKTFISLNEFRSQKPLPTKRRGLYWFWTNLSNVELEQTITLENTKEVPIGKLVKYRKGLSCVSDIKKDNFKIVYNGIGGYKSLSKSSSCLRKRINQEIRCKSTGTGTLNLINIFPMKNWAISYFDFDNEGNKEILKVLNSKEPYIEFAKELENLWRLEFGTPILCRH
tara:strand:+ start:119 stop:661 length:543 start_codon:yes stop_codon:yes gene_type:complete